MDEVEPRWTGTVGATATTRRNERDTDNLKKIFKQIALRYRRSTHIGKASQQGSMS